VIGGQQNSSLLRIMDGNDIREQDVEVDERHIATSAGLTKILGLQALFPLSIQVQMGSHKEESSHVEWMCDEFSIL
jgi:hypothetical protein